MPRLLLLLAAILFLSPARGSGQPSHDLEELRAVWLTTAFRLDWPPAGTNVQQHQDALRDIIADAYSMGLNAVFFQVVARGDAMYQSDRLPWSPYLTGTPGGDPGWDPLQFAIDEAHRRGMELHAWFNVFLVGNNSVPRSSTSDPPHIVFAEPSWIREEGTNQWVDPGLPAVRDWLVGNAVELVSNYNIDAIHFDYIRYPTGGFATDSQTMAQHNPNNQTTLANWRRDNVSEFVRAAYPAVKAARPWVKVGSAPIANYQWYSGAPPAAWAYSDFFQESRRWVQEGVHDYLAPQNYFTIGTEPEPGNAHASPDFDYIAREWMANRHNRQIYIGMGPYKAVVKDELPEQIDTTRAVGAFGQSYYRYQSIVPDPFGGRYANRALPPPMPWLNPESPGLYGRLDIWRDGSDQTETIEWNPAQSSSTDPLKGYAVFRNVGSQPDVTDPAHLAVIVGPEITSVTFNSAGDVIAPSAVSNAASLDDTYYRVFAFSHLGGRSQSIGSTPLPIVFDRLFAISNNSTVTVGWHLTSELHAGTFEVEHRRAGDAPWSTVALRYAHSETTGKKYREDIEGLAPGIHYFRIAVRMDDGSLIHSEVVETSVDIPSGYKVGDIFPNPSDGSVSVSITVDKPQQVNVRFYDVAAREVAVETRFLGPGYENEITLPVRDMPPGLYLVVVEGEDFRETRTITVLN